MNILPVIITFLTILSLITYGFVYDRKSTHLETWSYQGYMRAERSARNGAQSKLYQKSKSSDKKTAGFKTPSKDYISQRTKVPPNELSRFNLRPLFTQNPSPILYDAAANLIKRLYQNTSFFKEIPDFQYQLLDSLIEKGRAKETLVFSDLFPDLPKQRDLFYKMLKGTNYYDLESGYPPFSDYFTLNKKKSAINFPFASTLLLECLFGKETCKMITTEEKKKWMQDGKLHSLKENELTTLLSKNPKLSMQLSQMKEFLDFSTKRQTAENRYKDTKTSISVRKLTRT